MKFPAEGDSYFFVDESGDSTFYDAHGNFIVGNEGCSPILVLGFVETQNPQALRQAILKTQQEVIGDPYLMTIPSISKTAMAFHAKDDSAEIRYIFFKLIMGCDFKSQFIVARKTEAVFRKYEGDENRFYDSLVTELFQNVLHRFQNNHIILSTRGSRKRREPLERAILSAKGKFEKQYNIKVDAASFDIEPQSPKGEPCLSVIDYMNWAVYRAYTRKEMRYFDYVSEKVSYLRDLYDPASRPYSRRKNPFDIKKAAPL